MSLLICFGLGGYTLFQCVDKDARHGMWLGWMIGLFIAPAWMIKWIGPANFDPRMCAAGAGILGLILAGEKIKFKMTLMDWCFVAYFVVNIISQKLNNDLTAGTFCAFTRRWVFPYIIGRLFLSKYEDIHRVVPYFAKFLLICSCLAIVEAIGQKNLMNLALGKSFYILDQTSEGFRWGMKRAHGNTEHPIYFGLMMCMLFPWAIHAGRLAWLKKGPKWWLAVPPVMWFAIIVTVSRGAQIGSVICMAVAVFFRVPKLRVAMLIAAVALGLGKDALKEKAMEILSKAAGESQHEEKWVPINGEEYLYTGTRHRMLLFVAYERGIQQTGWFGYGAAMRNVPVYEDAAERFSSIDCHYLVLLLQHGWAGIYSFCAMLGLSVLYSAYTAWRVDNWCAHITSAMCGAMIAVGMLMGSAFFHPHYGGVWMFTCGFLACVKQMPSRTTVDFSETASAEKSDPGDSSVAVASENSVEPQKSGVQKPHMLRHKVRRAPGHAPVRR